MMAGRFGDQVPVDLMRGQDHLGRPLIACCICFSMFYKHQLYRQPDGMYVDICKECQKEEEDAIRMREMQEDK